MNRLATFSLVVLLTACGGADKTPADTPAEQTVANGDLTPVSDHPTMTTPDGRTVYQPPFSAEEIRQGTPDGLTQHIVIREGGQRFVVRVSFAMTHAEGVLVTNVPVDGNGKPLSKGAAAQSTWAELESHAYYDAATTAVSRAIITTSMGQHEALVFTQTTQKDGATQVDRAWFALDLPGAPVRYEKSVDGEQIMTMEIVDRAVVEESGQ